MTIVTIACGEGCAEVEAVATGGQAPYTFTWEDGSTNPVRRICPSAMTEYEVTVTDAGVSGGEFHTAAADRHSARDGFDAGVPAGRGWG